MQHVKSLVFIDAVARAGSIRRAAETLAITSTALNRRILAVEEELGTPIFERLSNGVRLSAAGELYILHIRQQLSDLERVRSQIADLSSVRRGHVSVACGQALMLSFLPNMVANYRAEHPGVTFNVFVAGRQQAAQSLIDFSADISVVFEPEKSLGVQVLMEVPQHVHALVSWDHPLAGKSVLRLSDCVGHPMALPSQKSGLRHLLDKSSAQRNLNLPATVESDCADFLIRCIKNEKMIAFQIPLALTAIGVGTDIKAIPVNLQDVSLGHLQVSQQRGRCLPVAAARFASFITDGLQEVALLGR